MVRTIIADTTIYYIVLLFLYFIERETIIANAIRDAIRNSNLQEEHEKLAHPKIGPLTSSDILSKRFKKASKAATAQGKARDLMEDMVRRAEKELLKIKKGNDRYKHSIEDVHHRPGRLLKRSEVARLLSESGCKNAERIPVCEAAHKYRTINGTCNNLRKPFQGSAHTAFRRLIPSKYEDGVSDMVGKRQANGKNIKPGSGPFDPPYPSPRFISQRIVANDSSNELPLTHMVMQWGQFLDHDLDLAPEPEDVKCDTDCSENDVCQPIHIHPNDKVFGGTRTNTCMPFKRSIPACTSTASGRFSPREQINDLTSYIDGSQIYGTSDELARKLRTFRNGELKMDNKNNLLFTNEDCLMDLKRCHLTGEVRGNEQVGLTAMHTLWVREHNRIAKQLKIMNSRWNDEKLYQEARKIIGAMLQKITYKDFLPKLMASSMINTLIPPYKGYNASVDASIPNVFATGAFRFGHSLVRPVFSRYLSDLYERGTNKPLDLAKSFFNITAFEETGLGAIFRGLATDSSRRMDESLNSVLTTKLFDISGNSSPLDLAALNIKRQRDHGLPSYTVWRNYCICRFPRLPLATMRSHTLHRKLLETYGNLENVDFWLGGISETRLRSGVLGPTFACIFGLTFQNLRDGDRFWYERPGVFTSLQRREINRATLSRVICDNTDINLIQRDSFLKARRVICSNLPRMNLRHWQQSTAQEACYFKIGQLRGKSGCIKISCPSRSSFNKRIIIWPITETERRNCRIAYVNPKLPRNRVTNGRSMYYASGFRPSLINSQSGVYKGIVQCQGGSALALRYNCNGIILSDNNFRERGKKRSIEMEENAIEEREMDYQTGEGLSYVD